MPKYDLVFDLRGEDGVTLCSGWWPFFDYRRPTVAEVWKHRIDEQKAGVREAFDPGLNYATEQD